VDRRSNTSTVGRELAAPKGSWRTMSCDAPYEEPTKQVQRMSHILARKLQASGSAERRCEVQKKDPRGQRKRRRWLRQSLLGLVPLRSGTRLMFRVR
jgi:hypothetical protein